MSDRLVLEGALFTRPGAGAYVGKNGSDYTSLARLVSEAFAPTSSSEDGGLPLNRYGHCRITIERLDAGGKA